MKNKIIHISQFHSSVCLFVGKDLEKRLENLKISSNISKEINLSKAHEENLRQGLSDLKNSRFTESEVSEEYNKVYDYLNSSSSPNVDRPEGEITSFDESFPNYFKKSNLLESSESESVFDVTREISKVLQNCISSGTFNTDCVEKINLSSMIRKVMSNESHSRALDFCNAEKSNIYPMFCSKYLRDCRKIS